MKLVLAGILKNEASCIAECLDTFKPVIDKVVLTDTGSTDGTPDVIRAWMAANNVPGVVYECPWPGLAKAQGLPHRPDGEPPRFHFDRARNTAVALACAHADNPAEDWLFEIDGAWKLKGDVEQLRGGLESADPRVTAFELMVNQVGASSVPYLRLRRVRECAPVRQGGWRWEGRIHEHLWRPDNAPVGRIEGIWIDHEDTPATAENRRKRYESDIEVLREEIAEFEAAGVVARPHEDYDRGRLTRAWFYLGQSLENAGDPAGAYEAYVTRIKLQGAVEEWASAAYRAGRLAARGACLSGDRTPSEVARRWFLASHAVGGRPEGLWAYAALADDAFGAPCDESVAAARLAFECARATVNLPHNGFGYTDAYALASFGPAKDSATIAARIKQLRLLGVGV